VSETALVRETGRAARPARPPVREGWRPYWQDRRGRTVPIKAVTFALTLLPALVLAVQYATDDLGARPVKAVYLWCGIWAVRFLLLSLAVTPAKVLFAWQQIALVRRMLGVAALAYAFMHLCIYAASEHFRVLFVASEIVHRIYLTIGFTALCGLGVLGATSFDSYVRSMGKRWKSLQRWVFAIAVLAILHFFMQSKGDVSQAVLMGGLFLWLMLWRALPIERRSSLPLLFAMIPIVAVGTAGLEIAWYGLATHIPVSRVIAANLRIGPHLRAADWVAIIATGVALAVSGWRMLGWLRLRREPAPNPG
jgi:sulfoxide reductase heme-binding subunit YedZ